MKTLYDIKHEYLYALEQLLSIPDLDRKVIEDSLAGIKDELENKALNVAAYIKDLEAQIENMRNYEKRMVERRKTCERSVEHLRNYLKFNLQAAQIKKIKGSEFDVSIRPAVQKLVLEEAKIGKEWFREETISKLDREALRFALESGRQIEGAQLQDQVSLIIK